MAGGTHALFGRPDRFRVINVAGSEVMAASAPSRLSGRLLEITAIEG
jgi:hypothetical protein